MVFFWRKERLKFKKPAKTSRNTLMEKNSFIIELTEGRYRGVGECSLIPSLSPETESEVVSKLNFFQNHPDKMSNFLSHIDSVVRFPALVFAIEMALIDLKHQSDQTLFPSAFTRHEANIPINGLVWMDDFDGMNRQVDSLLAQSFESIKIKVGLCWEKEKKWLQALRDRLPDIEIRLDANGAFSFDETFGVLKDMHRLGIHSVEQPICPGQVDLMRTLCENTPVPIALDEELIGVRDLDTLIHYIKPQFVILKPSLIGGFSRCQSCISAMNNLGRGWWVTSALESNIGLNAIAQWVFMHQNSLLQGLGTGSLFLNNLPAPIYRKGAHIYCSAEAKKSKEIL